MSGIVWEEPPENTRNAPYGASRFTAVFAELEEHPGRWARVGEYRTRASASTTQNRLKHRFPRHEVSARQNGDGFVLYARFKGEE